MNLPCIDQPSDLGLGKLKNGNDVSCRQQPRLLWNVLHIASNQFGPDTAPSQSSVEPSMGSGLHLRAFLAPAQHGERCGARIKRPLTKSLNICWPRRRRTHCSRPALATSPGFKMMVNYRPKLPKLQRRVFSSTKWRRGRKRVASSTPAPSEGSAATSRPGSKGLRRVGTTCRKERWSAESRPSSFGPCCELSVVILSPKRNGSFRRRLWCMSCRADNCRAGR